MKSGGSALEFVKVMALGGAAGFFGDMITEVTRFPFLNDPTFIYPSPTTANFEAISYIAGAIMAGLGFIDMVTGVSLGGIGKSLMPSGMGLILGTTLYDTHGAKLLGVRPPDVHVAAAKYAGYA